MVSFWPFGRSDSSSAASFEKTLSQLSTRINRYASQTEVLRSKQRRFKALWTLYSAFAYILIAAILVLVTGWDKWSALEYTAIAGGPVAIYGTRKTLDAWYNYRIASTQSHLEEASIEREKVIQRLKAATKYDSTQQLLDKYGGIPKQQQQQQGKSPKRKPSGRQSLPNQPPSGPRTGFAPPPTANIPSRQPPPQNPLDARLSAHTPPVPPSSGPGESFAPNAFSSYPAAPPPAPPSQYAPPAGPAWYDRILDVVLGEDETQAKNRFALICAHCRLVNGQAPPGARSLEDVGRWKCKECGTLNGVESEVGKVLEHAQKSGVEVSSPVRLDMADEEQEDSPTEVKDDSDSAEEVARAPEAATPAGSTRSKARQRRKA